MFYDYSSGQNNIFIEKVKVNMDNQTKLAFDVLEVSYDATLEETKQAYRDLIQIWHPDKHHDNERLRCKGTEKLKEINAAWEGLQNWFTDHIQEAVDKREQERKDKEPSEEHTKERESAERPDSEHKTREDARYIHLDCPSCRATTRVLYDKSVERKKCGSCGKFIDIKKGSDEVSVLKIIGWVVLILVFVVMVKVVYVASTPVFSFVEEYYETQIEIPRLLNQLKSGK